jgi:mannose-6-phosphate isomerase-like protein (cupin superfamily)
MQILLLLLLIVIGICIYYFYFRVSKLLPYHENIENKTLENENYRKVEYTTDSMQLVYMNLQQNQEIGNETHPHTTQFIRVEKGDGLAVINEKQYQLTDNSVVIIPPNTPHNIIAKTNMKLYTLYSPPEHVENLTQVTKK